MGLKLKFELVPETCWYSNVRSEVSASTWNAIKQKTASNAGKRCEICNGVGKKWPVECHEIWKYEDGKQTLKGFIALCPKCHEVKHIGYANIQGRFDQALKHFMKVNGCTRAEALAHYEKAIRKWEKRSQKKWKLDISFIDTYVTRTKTRF